MRPLVVVIAIAFLSACGDGHETASIAAELEQVQMAIRQKLEQLRAGSAPSEALEVTYSDMHAFHGGETLTVKGGMLLGRYIFRNEVSPEQIEPPPTTMTAEQLRRLVDLLLEIEAWEQRVPARTAVPDESSASLNIKIGKFQSNIWEWYNDLSGNKRMVRVKQMLEEIAGPVPNK